MVSLYEVCNASSCVSLVEVQVLHTQSKQLSKLKTLFSFFTSVQDSKQRTLLDPFLVAVFVINLSTNDKMADSSVLYLGVPLHSNQSMYESIRLTIITLKHHHWR